jgi:hypothetical protein
MPNNGQDEGIKTLILDIETYPGKAYVWSLWDDRINVERLIDSGGILCWSAKWAGSDELIYSGLNITNKRAMLRALWKLLDEADEVVGYNSDRFDLKWINGQFFELGMLPPSPYKKIDLMKVVKKHMRFLSNRMAYIAGRIGLGEKTSHGGFSLWQGCMNKDPEAWALMEEYNGQDINLTEQLYDKLRPWISTGINRSLYTGNCVCPNCGSADIQHRGWHYTKAFKWKKFVCKACGSWGRSDERLPRDTKKNPMMRPL